MVLLRSLSVIGSVSGVGISGCSRVVASGGNDDTCGGGGRVVSVVSVAGICWKYCYRWWL